MQFTTVLCAFKGAGGQVLLVVCLSGVSGAGRPPGNGEKQAELWVREWNIGYGVQFTLCLEVSPSNICLLFIS